MYVCYLALLSYESAGISPVSFSALNALNVGIQSNILDFFSVQIVQLAQCAIIRPPASMSNSVQL